MALGGGLVAWPICTCWGFISMRAGSTEVSMYTVDRVLRDFADQNTSSLLGKKYQKQKQQFAARLGAM
jgi:hypothetical protein